MSHLIYLNDQYDDTEELNLSHMTILDMPHLKRFSCLRILNISHNNIKRINTLPPNLIKLICSNNNLTTLPPLPDFLESLFCDHNQLKQLPKLPRWLTTLHCRYNRLNNLPKLNKYLKDLVCCFNNLNALPKLNDSLIELYCEHNQLTKLPKFPFTLVSLWCPYNQLVRLPAFNSNLEIVNCKHNQLIELPYLFNVNEMRCDHNEIRYAPYHINKDMILKIDNNPIQQELIPYYRMNEKNQINIVIIGRELDLFKLLRILYRLRKCYSAGKIKALIDDYVWREIRRPKIEEKYSPANLIKKLEQNGGDIEMLDSW